MNDWLLTACLVAPLVACIGAGARAVRARRRPMHYRVGYDALHPLPNVAPRPVPPVETRPENPMHMMVVARPTYRWWDASERERGY